MIIHLHILFSAISVICNFWLIFYINQKYNVYKYKFLKQLNYLIIIYLGFYVLGFFKMYLIKNVSELHINNLTDYIEDIWNILRAIVIYIMINMFLTLRNINLNKNTNYVVYTVITLVLSIATFGYLYSENSIMLSIGDFIFSFIEKYHNIVKVLILLIYLFFQPTKPKDIFKLGRTFSILLLIAYGFSFSIELIKNNININSLNYVILNFLRWFLFLALPFLWIKLYYLPYADSLKTFIFKQELFDYLFNKNNISVREQDIVKLIIDGKSNDEIKDELFISYHTVKNHLSSIYKKFNVKNRHELIHLMIKERNRVV